MSFLIDLTDERFKIPANQAVIDYIRRENPFAHSDIGAELIRLAKLVPDAQYYCPSFSSLAYVALHTKANIVFAIAIGMLKIDFRLSPALVSEAMGGGGPSIRISERTGFRFVHSQGVSREPLLMPD